MRRVDYMIGVRDFATLKAEQFMEEVVSYYHVEDTGDKLAGVITVTQDTPAMEIIQLLQSKHLIRIAVVDAQGKLLGVVARRDILLGYLRASKPIWTF